MYSKEFIVGPSDADQNLNLKLSSLFVMMQDVSMDHSEILNIGKANTIDKGLYWVITRYSISINRLPKYTDKVTVTTYAGDDMKYIFPRYIEVTDEKGDVLAKASATWLVLDKKTHKICFKPFENIDIPHEHKEGEEPLPRKLYAEETTIIDSRRVRNSDVDINNHLNNTRYIEYITDSRDPDFYSKHKIKHVLIEYKKEIAFNQQVDIYSSNNNPEYIEAKVGDEVCFEALIKYEE